LGEFRFITRSVIFVLAFFGIMLLFIQDPLFKQVAVDHAALEGIDDALESLGTEVIDEAAESALSGYEEGSNPLAGIPIIGEVAAATIAVARAIGSLVNNMAEALSHVSAVIGGMLDVAFRVASFDIPALRIHPGLQVFRWALAAQMWVVWPYIVIKLVRGSSLV
jgi:hypothetical protein